MDIKDMNGDVLYFLDRNAYDVNDPEERIVEMAIITKNNKSYAYAKQGHFTLEFEISADIIKEDNESDRPILFASRTAAQEQYNQDIEAEVNDIRIQSKEELLKQFYRAWAHDIRHGDVQQAMVDKIRDDFGIDVCE